MLNKIKWCLKQAFKLQYYSYYTENNIRYVCTWEMWLGKCYNIKKYKIEEMV